MYYDWVLRLVGPTTRCCVIQVASSPANFTNDNPGKRQWQAGTLHAFEFGLCIKILLKVWSFFHQEVNASPGRQLRLSSSACSGTMQLSLPPSEVREINNAWIGRCYWNGGFVAPVTSQCLVSTCGTGATSACVCSSALDLLGVCVCVGLCDMCGYVCAMHCMCMLCTN